MITREQYQFLKNHPSFEHLPVEYFDQIAKKTRFRKIPKGQIFFYAGDRREYLFVLFKGYARIEQYDETDTFSYLDYIREGGAFPFGDIFQNDYYHYTAIAVTDLEYFLIPMDLYEQTALKCPEQLMYICKKLSRILTFQEMRLRNAMSSRASERVEQILGLLFWDMCRRDQLVTLPFEMHIQEISRLAATTRETASHVMKQLKKDKRIAYAHKKLTFLDVDYFLENLTETY